MAELATKKFLDLTGLGAFWAKAKEYVDAKSSGLTDTINGLTLNYVSGEKKIYLKKGDTNLGAAIDCTDFIKDSFVQSGEIVEKEVGGVMKQTLRLTLITVERPGAEGTAQTVDIDVDKLFSQKAADIKMENGKTVEWTINEVSDNAGMIMQAHNALNADYQDTKITINGKISDLDAAYKAADTALDGRISALDTAYKAADTTINGRIDGVEAAYQAADTAVYNSITAIDTTDIDALFTGAQA